MAAIPDAVRAFATRPLTRGPDPPDELPMEKIRSKGLTILVLPGPTGALVEPDALQSERIETVLAQTRRILREHGKVRSAWFVLDGAEPENLSSRLQSLGLAPFEEPPFEPRFAAMARVEPPDPGPPEIEARAASTFDEYLAGVRLGEDVFALSEEDRKAWVEHEQTAWDLQVRGRSPSRSFVALDGDRVVGAASALLGEHAVNLLGGSVLPEARGRGVYRALVRARWDLAVARGTPALTVQAGAMSRPILERLGFEIVGWQDCLIDRLG